MVVLFSEIRILMEEGIGTEEGTQEKLIVQLLTHFDTYIWRYPLVSYICIYGERRERQI